MKKIVSLIFIYLIGFVFSTTMGFVAGTGVGLLIVPAIATHVGAMLAGISWSFWNTGFKDHYLS